MNRAYVSGYPTHPFPTFSPSPPRLLRFCVFIAASLAAGVSVLQANGILRNGVSAKSMSQGGASVADESDIVATVALNPALLGHTMSEAISVGLVGVVADGRYENPSGASGRLEDRTGLFPELVLRRPLTDRVGLGFSLIPEEARIADWHYEDSPGGIDGGTSYGLRSHRSEILGVRAALSLGWQISDTLSLGISGGVLYNENRLQAPYIFQSHPALACFKTLLDLETDGVGLNGDIGLHWRPTDSLSIGLTYRSPTRVETDGTARGDIGAQLDSLGLSGVPSTFAYQAEVENEFPQAVSAGAAWQVGAKTRLFAQVDWIGWEDSYDQLTVNLTEGSNDAINSLLGSDGIVDSVPLEWEDRLVYRAGLEHRLNETWAVRLGYAYGKAPMTGATTVPMTAAITEHTVSAGFGYARGPVRVDVAYQYDLPATMQMSQSRILSGEYRGATVDLSAHWLAITVGYEF